MTSIVIGGKKRKKRNKTKAYGSRLLGVRGGGISFDDLDKLFRNSPSINQFYFDQITKKFAKRKRISSKVII